MNKMSTIDMTILALCVHHIGIQLEGWIDSTEAEVSLYFGFALTFIGIMTGLKAVTRIWLKTHVWPCPIGWFISFDWWEP